MGVFTLTHRRKGKETVYTAPNGYTTAALNDLATLCFITPTTVITSDWYIGLIDIDGFTALSAADTHDSHAGWVEYTSYEQATRKSITGWAEGSDPVAGNRSVRFQHTGNHYQATRAIGGVKGVFLAQSSVKGDVSAGPILLSTALILPQSMTPWVDYLEMSPGDELSVDYLQRVDSDTLIETP